MSFQEKSAWVSLLSTVFIFASYFVTVFELTRLGHTDGGTVLGLFIGAVVTQMLVAGAVHIVFSTSGKSSDRLDVKDERDQSIDLRGYRNAYVVITGWVWLAICGLATRVLVGEEAGDVFRLTPFVVGHVLLLGYVVSEVVRYATQVFYYRRGC